LFFSPKHKHPYRLKEEEVIPQFVDRHYGAEPVVRPVPSLPVLEPEPAAIGAADTTVQQEDGFEADDEDGEDVTYLTGREFYSEYLPKTLLTFYVYSFELCNVD